MKKLLACLLTLVLCMAFAACSDKTPEQEESQIPSIIETAKFGTTDKVTAQQSFQNFNAQVEGNSSLNPAREDYYTINDKKYWYGLENGLYCYIVPQEFTGDQTKDITKQFGLSIIKGEEFKADPKAYLKLIIKANAPETTDADIEAMITEADTLRNTDKAAINGKGIYLRVLENDDEINYLVVRVYQ